MTIVFFILVVLACLVLGLLILIQNPKGGGLNGSIGGFNNQLMGVKQTNDVLEKGTWLFSGIIAFLCLLSVLFFKGTTASSDTKMLQQMNTNSAPALNQPAAPANTVPLDSQKH